MPRYLVLDLHCDPCRRLDCRQCVEALRTKGRLEEALAVLASGDPDWLRSAPRLARFVRAVEGGPIGAQPFNYKGQQVIPYRHVRPDGGVTWRMLCPHGHDKPIREERIVAEFKTLFASGQESRRSPF